MTESKDAFDGLDQFDLEDADSFDVAELDTEDKVLYSKELKDAIRKEVVDGVTLAKKAIEKTLTNKIQSTAENSEEKLESQLAKTKELLKDHIESVEKKEENLKERIEKLKEENEKTRNALYSSQAAPQYQFGGFAPPNPLGHVGEILTSTDGTWSGLQWNTFSSFVTSPFIISSGTNGGSFWIGTTPELKLLDVNGTPGLSLTPYELSFDAGGYGSIYNISGLYFADGSSQSTGYDATDVLQIDQITTPQTILGKLSLSGEVTPVDCDEVLSGSGSFNVGGAGFQNFTHDYVIYSYVTVGAVTAYNVIPFPINVSDYSGNFGEVSLSWVDAAGATGYIIWESINGMYVDAGGTTSYAHQDFAAWTSGAPSLTPATPQFISENLIEATNSVGASFVVDGSANLTLTGKIFVADGDETLPAFSFANQSDMGMYRRGAADLAFAFGGSRRMSIDATALTLANSLIFRSSGVGSASAPSYSWATDTNNGMFLPTTDTLAFSTASTERYRISSLGVHTFYAPSGVGTWFDLQNGGSSKMQLRWYGTTPFEEFEFYQPLSNVGMNFKTATGGLRIVPWTIGGADTLFFQSINQDFTFSAGGGVAGRLVTFSFATAQFTKLIIGSPNVTTLNLNVGTSFCVSNASSGILFLNFSGINYIQSGLTFAGGGEVAPVIWSGSQGYPELLYMSSTKTYTPQDFGVGSTAPSARIHAIKTTEQLRLGYDVSNYWKATVASTGGMTLAGVGTGGALTITPTAGQNINFSLSTTGDFAVNTDQFYVDTSTGNIGVGTSSPSSSVKLHIISTTEQLRLGYDASNYLSVTTASTGSTTFALTGTSPTFTFSQSVTLSVDLQVNGNTTLGNASTDTITHTGRMIVRTTASDPKDATAGNRPAGTVGEIAYYSGKMYFCVNSATPLWELITSA